MTSNTDKLKVLLDDLKNRVRVSESKLELHSSLLESQKSDISKLTERKDNTDHLKENHLQFTQSFNETVKLMHTQLDDTKTDFKSQLSLQDDKRLDMKKEIDEKIKELNTRIEVLNKMLDF